MSKEVSLQCDDLFQDETFSDKKKGPEALYSLLLMQETSLFLLH